MFQVEVRFNDSFYRKLNSDAYKQAITDTVEFVMDDIVEACKDEAPVRTGRLREGHYSRVEGLQGMVCNDVEYAPYVIYGTSRQAPNNYPQRVANRMNLTEKGKSRFFESLITQGVL